MRPTVRLLQQLEHSAHRIRSTSFIGLGRMGSEMAFNLFSKQYTQSQDSRFVICDALPESAKTFHDSFLAQFPGANLEIVNTPVQ
jgi:3-hydroxyisobutyrate dehydrogenase